MNRALSPLSRSKPNKKTKKHKRIFPFCCVDELKQTNKTDHSGAFERNCDVAFLVIEHFLVFVRLVKRGEDGNDGQSKSNHSQHRNVHQPLLFIVVVCVNDNRADLIDEVFDVITTREVQTRNDRSLLRLWNANVDLPPAKKTSLYPRTDNAHTTKTNRRANNQSNYGQQTKQQASQTNQISVADLGEQRTPSPVSCCEYLLQEKSSEMVCWGKMCKILNKQLALFLRENTNEKTKSKNDNQEEKNYATKPDNINKPNRTARVLCVCRGCCCCSHVLQYLSTSLSTETPVNCAPAKTTMINTKIAISE